MFHFEQFKVAFSLRLNTTPCKLLEY